MRANCSDDFPTTDVFYKEIADDVLLIVFMAVGSVLALIIMAMFVDEVVFLHKQFNQAELKRRKMIILLGLYPMISIASAIGIVVPTSTVLVDFIMSCYLSVCIYTFVTMMIGYFGGSEQMIYKLSSNKIRLNTPPCCCICYCLKPIVLSRKSLLYLELCSLQVALVRPCLVFIEAVLWTDGKYQVGTIDITSVSVYLNALSGLSTVVSIYGMIVIFRNVWDKLRHKKLGTKFASLQVAVICVNIQEFLFGFIARFNVPPCVGTRGPKVRAANLNHAVLIIEAFILSLLARRGYRRYEDDDDDGDVEPPVKVGNGYGTLNDGTIMENGGGAIATAIVENHCVVAVVEKYQ